MIASPFRLCAFAATGVLLASCGVAQPPIDARGSRETTLYGTLCQVGCNSRPKRAHKGARTDDYSPWISHAA